MKNTLRLIAAAAVLAVATPAFAQGGGGGGGQQMTPEQRMAQQKERYFTGITLSPAQSAKVDTILTQFATKQREAMQAANGDRAAMMPIMTKIRTEQAEALKAVLTADADKTKFDANVAAMPAGRGRGGN